MHDAVERILVAQQLRTAGLAHFLPVLIQDIGSIAKVDVFEHHHVIGKLDAKVG